MKRKRGVMPSILRTSVLALVAGAASLAACTATSPPEPESVAAREAAATRAAAERTAARDAAEADEAPPPRRREPEPVRETTVVVDPGGKDRNLTAGELAAALRADREKHGDRSVGELTDRNLAEMAAQGKVTYAGASAGAPAEGAAGDGDGAAGSAGAGEPSATATGDGSPEAPAEPPCGEICWRRRALELRRAWADAVERIDELEAEVAEQRWRFYAADDPWVRDSQVKPAWDRALDDLRHAREEAERYKERVAELLEEGRRAGALPGWLREGVHLEPRLAEPEDEIDPAEPREPVVLEDDAREPDRP